MKLKHIFIVLLSLSFLSISPAFSKENKTNIESKITMETSLENRLRQVLTEITGSDKLVVIINVQLATEEKREEPAPEKKDNFILPGVPIKEAMAEKQVGEAVRSALGEDTRTLLKKITATVILDKSASDAVVKVVKDVSAGLLGIDTARGDELIIQQMYFQKNPFYWGSIIYPPNLYWVVGILTSILFLLIFNIFLFGPLKGFTKELSLGVIAIADSIKGIGKDEEKEQIILSKALVEDEAQKISKTKESNLFSFIDENNVNALKNLMISESINNKAIIINYLSPEIAAEVLNELSPEQQAGIGLMLSKITELDSSEVETLEKNIKSRIEYLSGGENKLTDILNFANDTTKAKVISSIKDFDLPLSEKIHKSLFTIDILASLDVTGLQTLIKIVTPSIFAQVVKPLPEQIRNKILTTLPQGAQDRIKQEMELGRPFTHRRLEIEKRKIIETVKKLEARGMINLS